MEIIYKLSHDNQIATIMLNDVRKHNVLSLAMIQQLSKYYQQVNIDPKIKLLIIKANGKYFSSGADLNWFKSVDANGHKQNLQIAKQLAKMLLLLYNLAKPVLCAIQGDVYGGALGIIAGADIVIASNNSKFCFSEVKFGLAPAIIMPFILSAIPMHIVKYQILTATTFSAQQAFKFGFVHELIDKIDMATTIDWHINNIKSLGFNGIIASKKLLQQSRTKITMQKLNMHINMLAQLQTAKATQDLINQFFMQKSIKAK